MDAPDLHADRRELRYLQRYGVEVSAELGALVVRLPRPHRLARPGMLLMLAWGVLVPVVLASEVLPPLKIIVSVAMMVLLGLSALFVLAIVLRFVLEALTPFQRSLFTELVLSSRALQVGRRSPLPLEGLGTLSVRRRLGRWRLLAAVGGEEVLLVEMSSQTPLERLAVLLRRHAAHRQAVLEAEGHDLSAGNAPPVELIVVLGQAGKP